MWRMWEPPRFDVTSTRRTRAFHHFSVGGELSIEDAELLSEVIEEVSCRWCSSTKSVEVIDDSAEVVVAAEGGAPAAAKGTSAPAAG